MSKAGLSPPVCSAVYIKDILICPNAPAIVPMIVPHTVDRRFGHMHPDHCPLPPLRSFDLLHTLMRGKGRREEYRTHRNGCPIHGTAPCTARSRGNRKCGQFRSSDNKARSVSDICNMIIFCFIFSMLAHLIMLSDPVKQKRHVPFFFTTQQSPGSYYGNCPGLTTENVRVLGSSSSRSAVFPIGMYPQNCLCGVENQRSDGPSGRRADRIIQGRET